MPAEDSEERDVVSALVAARAFQHRCAELASRLPDTLSAPLESYGSYILWHSPPRRNAALRRLSVLDRARQIAEMMRRDLGVRVTVGVGALDPTNDTLPECGRQAAIALQLAVHRKIAAGRLRRHARRVARLDRRRNAGRTRSAAGGALRERDVHRDRCTPGRLRARSAVGIGRSHRQRADSFRVRHRLALGCAAIAPRHRRERAFRFAPAAARSRGAGHLEPRLGCRARRCAQGAGPRRQRAGAKPAEAEAGTSGALHRRALRGSAYARTSRAAGRTLEKLLLQQLCGGGWKRLCGLHQECSRGTSEAPAPVLDFTISRTGQQSGFVSVPHFNRAFKSAVGVTPSQYRAGFKTQEPASQATKATKASAVRR